LRPTSGFVDLKSEEQLDIKTLDRARSRPTAERPNLINQLRAIQRDSGVIFPAGRRDFELGLDDMLSRTTRQYLLASVNWLASSAWNGGRLMRRWRR
jgi:transposase